ncbi:ATP-binding cassette domain-containing protein [Paludicola sp. MB14-C6]|uniref:ABC transporter ATP-binding protein n=1 Tax=Paludihabitans sp. MB14-C6 TaxID=3070656 RepID=UPI0027DB5A65|nr:ATP-binding cassette domain-containing protein [Paludicola sp. MB14-C6]WMJ22132.1 ATP-binding cassette domain-containing protein [Paludicola sp. MB14-C6]
MIEVKNLTKRYGQKLAVDNVSFTVNKGEILGFLGPNGAGKSTTMNILTGYLSATDGVAKIGEFDILENPIEAKRAIGYLPEQPPLYLDMTVKEYLDFIYDLKKVKLPKEAHIKEVCDVVKISNVYNRVIKNLSKGYKQRVGLAQAIIGNPEVLILDEPTVGLDPKQIIEIRNLIKTLGQKHTVILSSHILPEIQAVCDRVIVISQGKLVANDTTTNLSREMSEDRYYVLLVEGPENDVYKTLQGIAGMKSVVTNGKRENNVYEYTVEAEENVDVRREIFKRLAERNWPMLGLRSSELSLEDIFLKLTKENGGVQ